MISVDWKKGETVLKGDVDVVTLEFTLLISTLSKLLEKTGMSDNATKKFLKTRIDIGMNMTDEMADFIISETIGRE